MTNYYAVALIACRNTSNGLEVNDCPAVVLASSEEEACGIVLSRAREEIYPEKDGWYNHKAQAVKVPAS